MLVGVICVLSLALALATFTNSSLTAAVGALVVFIVMNILGAFSYFDFLKPYLFTSHIDAWQNLFSQPIVWHPIVTGLIAFAIYIAGLHDGRLVPVPAQGHPGLASAQVRPAPTSRAHWQHVPGAPVRKG